MKIIVIAIILAGATATTVRAKTHPNAGAGTSIFPFLKMEVDARSMAMGGIGITNSAWSNPAVLRETDSRKISFSHIQGFQQDDWNFISYQDHPEFLRWGQGWGKGGIGLSLLHRGVNLENYDESGIKREDITTSDMVVVLSLAGIGPRSSKYAQHLLDGGQLFWGVNGKFINSRVEEYKAQGFVIDTGFLYQFSKGELVFKNYIFSLENLTLGLSLQNIGPKVKGDSLPLILRAGGTYQCNDRFLLALGLEKPRDNWISIGLGGEYQISDILFLRGGYRTGIDEGPGLSCGFGIKRQNLQLDYAYVPYGKLGNAHRITVSVVFGQNFQKGGEKR